MPQVEIDGLTKDYPVGSFARKTKRALDHLTLAIGDGQLFGMSRDERRQRSQELLRRVDLTAAADVQLRKYSKGMTQRLGVAQALLNRPRVVFLDEPMSGLD